MTERNTLAPIVIEGAMDCEMSHIIGALSDAHTYSFCGYPVTEGKLGDMTVVAALNQVGMVNAACLTSLLIQRYSPLCVVSQGTAGSYSAELKTGDVILGKEIRNINCINMRPDDCRRLEELSGGEWLEMQAFSSDSRLADIAEKVPYAYGNIIKGSIASCDFWSYDAERIHEIRARFGSDCEEMETFAAAQVCRRMDVPFLSIRVISNNELSGEGFSAEAALRCQEYTLDVVRAIAAEHEKTEGK